MVREGENPKRDEAVCCRVEVVKGAFGFRIPIDSLISITDHDPASPVSIIRKASLRLVISFEHARGN